MPVTPKAPDPTQNTVFDAPLATITILLLIVIGGVDVVIDGHLSGDYIKFIETVAIPLAGLAVGRGFAARKAG